MDKLEELLQRQKELDSFIADRRKLEFDKNEWIRNKCVALLVEVSELLDECNYKWWKNPKENNDRRIKEEIIDVLHFFLGICNDAGIDAQELFDMYLEKNDENHKRQTGNSEKTGYKS